MYKNIILSLLLVFSTFLQSYSNKISDISDKNIMKSDSVACTSKYMHLTRDISFKEAAITASLIQLVYLGGYVITQYDNIKENGSLDKWMSNFGKVHFDKDSYDYNIITHVGNAHFSYLFYRSMGYKKLNSFVMTYIGSTFFEFFIETVTEPASMQDLWQTPALGTLLGMGCESLGLYLINTDYTVAHVAGYILNPFMLFSKSHYKFVTVPILSKDYAGMNLSLTF